MVIPGQMTVKELEARIRYHEANAEVFSRQHEESMAKQFLEDAAKYREELARREALGPEPEKEDWRTILNRWVEDEGYL
jgi:hypothetical protein